MSWIVSLFKFPENFRRIADFETFDGDDPSLPLGTKAEILALLKQWFPETEGQNPEWMSVDGRGEMSEIILSGINQQADSELIYSIGFRNPSYRLLRDVCAKMGWIAFDPSDGEFIDFESVPPEYFSQLFIRKEPQRKQTVADVIIYFRKYALEAHRQGDREALGHILIALELLGDSLIEAGDRTYWEIVDKLTYFVRHTDIADPTFYVATEAAIRELES